MMEQLERLERDTARATEAAFYLAQNAAVTRFLLDEAKAPVVGAVAVALDHPSDGPFLVVTREGAALECLRRGARPRMPVVTRAQLETVAVKHDALKPEVLRWGPGPADAERGATGFRPLFRTLLDGGEAVAAETLRSLAPFLPLVFEKLPALWYACDDTLRDFVKRSGERLIAERAQLDARGEEQVRRTWRLHWAVGHLQALFAQADDDTLRQAAGGVIQGAAPIRATRLGFWPVALRGLSLCGRLGASLLTGLEHGLKAPPDTVHEALTSAHGLGFVGAAHPKYRHEVVLRLGDTFEGADPRSAWLARERLLVAEALTELETDTGLAEKQVVAQLEELASRGVEVPRPATDEGPEERTLVRLANLPVSLHGRVGHVLIRHGLGAFARTPIEDLYPSAAELAARPPVDPLSAGFRLLEVAVEHLGRLKRG
ncbi:MAG: hypothetical protein JNJ59_17800 [Deltaproteobacteria bacterium]|jgi:hypothetical protein|nr:hypothetical protein [Deltaproteobacteria bacterium]